jgi:hypothetical protein
VYKCEPLVGGYLAIRRETHAEPFDVRAAALSELRQRYMQVPKKRPREEGEAAELASSPTKPVDNHPVVAAAIREALNERDNEAGGGMLTTTTEPRLILLLLLLLLLLLFLLLRASVHTHPP